MQWPADPTRARVQAIGECMLELRHTAPTELRLSYAGDTYNTAVYLRRSLNDHRLGDTEVGYLTGLGADPYSEQLRQALHAEGIADHTITQHGRLPGVYAIDTDSAGERTFSYWRTDSAAAHMFKSREWIAEVTGDLIHFSGITLQLMSNSTRNLFLSRLLELGRQGSVVSFDTNYRPAGWPTIDAARSAFEQAAKISDIVLASADDEEGLAYSPDPDDIVDRYRSKEVNEIVVKLGSDGVLLAGASQRQRVSAAPAAEVIDTTAAGDSFAGAYLAARLAGHQPAEAAEAGVALAARVIQHPGAITPIGTAAAVR